MGIVSIALRRLRRKRRGRRRRRKRGRRRMKRRRRSEFKSSAKSVEERLYWLSSAPFNLEANLPLATIFTSREKDVCACACACAYICTSIRVST